MVRMKGEPSQSSSSPRSIITSRQPRPSVIRPSPMKSAGALCFLAQGGSSTSALTASTAKMPIGTLMKNTQRQDALSVM